jgi:hypothetical protein
MANELEDVNTFTLDRHPISAALDSLDRDESQALYQSVRQHGVVGRVIVGHVTGSPDHGGTVIDGWHTLCAWKEACRHQDHFAQRYPIAPHVERMWFASEQEMREFGLSMQLGRRNLDEGKCALLVIRSLKHDGHSVPHH